jgi:hypothetical protein
MQHIGHNVAPVGFVPKRGQPPSDVMERSLDLYLDTERGSSLRRMRALKPTGGSPRIWPDGPEVPSYPSAVIRSRRGASAARWGFVWDGAM